MLFQVKEGHEQKQMKKMELVTLTSAFYVGHRPQILLRWYFEDVKWHYWTLAILDLYFSFDIYSKAPYSLSGLSLGPITST